MLDEFEKRIRNIHSRLLENKIDLVYYSKVDKRLDHYYLEYLLKIEALIQKSYADYFLISKA